MSKMVRRQFLGNWLLFLGLCISIVGIPIAILYYKESMVVIEEDLEDPASFLQAYRAGRFGR